MEGDPNYTPKYEIIGVKLCSRKEKSNDTIEISIQHNGFGNKDILCTLTLSISDLEELKTKDSVVHGYVDYANSDVVTRRMLGRI